jgi:hypothetical protein
LSGGESDNIVILVVSEEYIEIVEITPAAPIIRTFLRVMFYLVNK